MTLLQLRWTEALPYIQPLFAQNYEEISLVKEKLELDIDYELYRAMENLNRLRVFVLKNGEDVVGYAVFFVSPHHPRHMTKSLVYNDVVYLSPDYRKGMTGVRFIRDINKLLKEEFDIVVWHVKDRHDFSPILTRDGFIKQDVMYSWVGD